MSALRRRPTLAAALVYALLAVAFVSPALMPGKVLSNSDSLWFVAPWSSDIPEGLERPANDEVGDAPAVLFPFVEYTKSRLPDVPLWNPHIVGGRPFLANMQSAIFSPFSVPSYVMPFYESLALVAALKLFVAAFGTYLLSRALGMRFGGGLFAGVAFGFNLWLVTWLVYPHSSVWALMPLLLFLVVCLVRRPDALRTAALALVAAAILVSGHPESAAHALGAALALLVLRVVQARRSENAPAARPLLMFAGAIALSVALAAVAIVPFAELLLRSADIDQRGGSGDDQIVQARFLFGILIPDYWGRPTGTPLEGFLLSRALFGGVLTVVLAAAALLLKPTGERVAVGAFGLVCLLVVVGAPGVFDLVTALPPFSSGHNTRLAILFLLCLALLGGWGFDDVIERRPGRLVSFGLAGLMLFALAWVLGGGKASLSDLGPAARIGLAFGTPPPLTEPGYADVIRLASLLAFLVLAGTALALLALRGRGRIGPTLFGVAAVALCVVDLFRIGVGYNPAIDRSVAEQPATGAVRYLESRRPLRFVGAGQARQIPQNIVGMRFGLYEARGYDLPVDRRYDRLWRREVSPEYPSQVGPFPGYIPLSVPRFDERRLRTLSLLGVGDVLVPPTDPPLRAPGLRIAYDGADATVYANDEALPRTWVVGAQEVAGSEREALDEVTDPGFDPMAKAVVESDVKGLPRQPGLLPAGSSRIESYGPERVTLRARAARPSLLVLSDLHYPGWKATLDGRDVPIERTNYVMRGVSLPPGEHRVEFRYEPLSWRIGWIVSLLGLLALAAIVALGVRRRSCQ